MFYRNQYDINIDKSDIEQKIGSYLDQEIEVSNYKKINNKYIVSFNFFDKKVYEGITILSQGINSKYRIGDLSYSSDEGFKFANYKIKGEDYLILYGYNEFGANEILIKFRNAGSLNFELKEDKDVLIIKKSIIKKSAINLYNLKFSDKENEIVRIKPLTTDSIDYRGEVLSGPESIVYVSSVLIVLIGYVISYSLKKQPRFYKYIEDKRTQNMILSNYSSNSHIGE